MHATSYFAALVAVSTGAHASPINSTLVERGASTLDISVWPFAHAGCGGRSQRDLKGLVYGQPYPVPHTFYSYELSRPLAEHEELSFLSGDMEFGGSYCLNEIATEDWTLPGKTCATAGWATCIILKKK